MRALIQSQPHSRWGLTLEIFVTFFRIGLFTFGGGFAMLPLIERDVVRSKGWLDQDSFMECVSATQVIPGALAINTAILTGRRIQGLLGCASAVLGVTLPSFFIILIIATLMAQARSVHYLEAFFSGVRPVVVGLVIGAGIRVGKRSVRKQFDFVVVGLLLVGLSVFNISPIFAIVVAGCFGLFRRS